MSVKIKPADTWFSKCVRAANDWTCEKCKTKYEEGSQGLHCSHIFSRRHRTIRWCKDNAQALCFSCHQWFGGNPADSGIWIAELLGEPHIKTLRQKRDYRSKISKQDEKFIAKHYRGQFIIIKQKRLYGICDYIDFVSWQ